MSCDRRMARPTRSGARVAWLPCLVAIACAGEPVTCLPEAKTGFLDEQIRSVAPRRASKERRRLVEALASAECAHDVDALLLLAVAERESSLDPEARGPEGGIGLLQVRAPTGEYIAGLIDRPWEGEASLFDPEVNVDLGAAYLRRLHGKFGNWEASLSAYNLGPTRLRHLMKRGQRGSSPYARKILARYGKLVKSFDVESAAVTAAVSAKGP